MQLLIPAMGRVTRSINMKSKSRREVLTNRLLVCYYANILKVGLEVREQWQEIIIQKKQLI